MTRNVIPYTCMEDIDVGLLYYSIYYICYAVVVDSAKVTVSLVV